jgi:hypothetical protein
MSAKPIRPDTDTDARTAKNRFMTMSQVIARAKGRGSLLVNKFITALPVSPNAEGSPFKARLMSVVANSRDRITHIPETPPTKLVSMIPLGAFNY